MSLLQKLIRKEEHIKSGSVIGPVMVKGLKVKPARRGRLIIRHTEHGIEKERVW